MSDIYAKSFKFGENGDHLYPLPMVTEEDNDSVLSVVNGSRMQKIKHIKGGQ